LQTIDKSALVSGLTGSPGLDYVRPTIAMKFRVPAQTISDFTQWRFL